jgi:zeaxanthin glucosyltransferase
MLAEGHRWHFGVLSFTGTGHLNPLISLSQQLQSRGHKVTFFEKPKIEARVRQAGIEFVPIGADRLPPKAKKPVSPDPSFWQEVSTLRSNLKRVTCDLEMFLQETPSALARAGVNALIVNEIALTGPTIAEMLYLPYFIISTSVPHSFGWSGHPWCVERPASRLFRLQRAWLEISALRMRGPIRRALDSYRQREGLGSVRKMRSVFPELAQITQLPQCLDLPRAALPRNFHYTGPFVNRAARPKVEFPWNSLDGRPIIYASLGTTRNVRPAVFRLVAEVCQKFDLQLVISLGNRFCSTMFADLPGEPVVVRYAPQLELLQMARIVITHGGSNTVFEALLEGKPMLVIPIAHDQPAVAARLARLKIAEVIPVEAISATRLHSSMVKLLSSASYDDAAKEAQARIRSMSGLERAVEIIEEALSREIRGRSGQMQAAGALHGMHGQDRFGQMPKGLHNPQQSDDRTVTSR